MSSVVVEPGGTVSDEDACVEAAEVARLVRLMELLMLDIKLLELETRLFELETVLLEGVPEDLAVEGSAVVELVPVPLGSEAVEVESAVDDVDGRLESEDEVEDA